MAESYTKLFQLPMTPVSEAIIAQDAPAALAYLERRGTFDLELLEALGLDKYQTEV